jgi:hypothetical protein
MRCPGIRRSPPSRSERSWRSYSGRSDESGSSAWLRPSWRRAPKANRGRLPGLVFGRSHLP